MRQAATFEDELDLGRSQAAEALSAHKLLVYGMNFSPEMAGVGRYTGDIADYFARSGAHVTVLTTPPHYPGWQPLFGYANSYQTEATGAMSVYRVPAFLRREMKGIWRLVAPLVFAFTSAPVLLYLFVTRRPTHMICVEPTLFAAPFALLLARLFGTRAVLHVQDLEVDAAFAVGHLSSLRWLKGLGLAFDSFVTRRFSGVVTISGQMADQLRAKGVADDRLHVIRNWVDLGSIHPLEGPNAYRTELGISPDETVVLYSGNIGAKQGLDCLLDAAAQLTADEGIRIVIAGEGPEKAGLMSRYGHLSHVRFLDFQPAERFNELLNMADIHVLPQKRAAADLVLPSKLGGMLASGRQILVTADDDTELARFLGDTVLRVAPEDADAMARAIRSFRADPADPHRQSRLALAASLSKGKALKGFSGIVFNRTVLRSFDDPSAKTRNFEGNQ